MSTTVGLAASSVSVVETVLLISFLLFPEVRDSVFYPNFSITADSGFSNSQSLPTHPHRQRVRYHLSIKHDLAFHPTAPVLATLSEDGTAI